MKEWDESEWDARRERAARAYEKERHRASLRHDRLRGASGRHSLEEWEAILAAHDHACVFCGATKEITKDHIVPISRGGTNYANNLQPLCMPCNTKKGTSMAAAHMDKHGRWLPEQSRVSIPLSDAELLRREAAQCSAHVERLKALNDRLRGKHEQRCLPSPPPQE
jgi:5-methylcytosine-specific restriction endonuclease McrA